MVEQSGKTAVDRAEVGWRIFHGASQEERAVSQVRAVFDALLAHAKTKIASTAEPISAILDVGSDHQQNKRPGTTGGLRFSAAGSGEA
jgi:hypothetical protein